MLHDETPIAEYSKHKYGHQPVGLFVIPASTTVLVLEVRHNDVMLLTPKGQGWIESCILSEGKRL